MILGNAYNENELNRIEQLNTFCIIDNEKNPEKYLKSILIHMNTKQAKIIRDYLNKQIDQYPDNRIGVGIIIHTGLCA